MKMVGHIGTFLMALFMYQCLLAEDPVRGYLASPGFINQPVKSTFFFSGNWRNGVQFYDYNPSDNRGLYTVHPSDARHLGWSENVSFRNFAVQTMVEAGVNVINMSYWGLPGSDNWANWSPMQTSTASHDQLFDAALGKEILIAPYIESFAKTDHFDGFSFADDFPGSASNPAPLLVTMIEDLVNRYLVGPANAQWPSKWAQVYDKNGTERYLISIIHVASNQSPVTDQVFAEGFDLVAGAVFESTGIHVGFALDILPPDSYAPGLFKATPASTGPWLSQQNSVLAIQCFIPEIWKGISDENLLIAWKREYQTAWINTGIPFIHDLSSGYDAHVVFPTSPVYGNNQLWLDLQTQAINDFGSQAFTFNAWNGYTEGLAGVPTLQYGDQIYNWISELFYIPEDSTGLNHDPVWFKKATEVFPNPVTGMATLRLLNQGEPLLSFKLVNMHGKVIETWEATPGNGPIYSVEINMIDLPAGSYYFIAHTDKTTCFEKILRVE